MEFLKPVQMTQKKQQKQKQKNSTNNSYQYFNQPTRQNLACPMSSNTLDTILAMPLFISVLHMIMNHGYATFLYFSIKLLLT